MIAEELSISDINHFNTVLKEHSGFDFSDYAQSSLRRRIRRLIAINRFESVSELTSKMARETSFAFTCVEEITVNVTEMFRDPEIWVELRDVVLPSLLKNHSKIRVWHSGVSTGEELFSLRILCEELGVADRVKMIGSDLSQTVIEKANLAIINSRDMLVNARNYGQYHGGDEALYDYFEKINEKQYQLKKEYRDALSFEQHDLIHDEPLGTFDLIFCRNVMIYFNQKLQNEVLAKFDKHLYKNASIVLGSKESMIWSDIKGKYLSQNQSTKIYQKID